MKTTSAGHPCTFPPHHSSDTDVEARTQYRIFAKACAENPGRIFNLLKISKFKNNIFLIESVEHENVERVREVVRASVKESSIKKAKTKAQLKAAAI